MRNASLIAMIALAMASLPEGVSAAIGLCRALAVGEAESASSELDARRAALARWTRLAETHGPGYTRWALAWGRHIDCSRSAAGIYSCKAAGRPCSISQVPVGNLPILKRGDK